MVNVARTGAVYSCSNCGTPVSKNTASCPHCYARLSGIRCTNCKFAGSESDFVNDRCPKCGTITIRPQPAPARAPRPVRPSRPPWQKSPAGHAIASCLLPGLGTILCGKTRRGLSILGLSAVFLIGVNVLADLLIKGTPTGIGTFLAIPVWIWGIIDGYRTAEQWNREHPAPQPGGMNVTSPEPAREAATSWSGPDPADEDGYVRSCSETAFSERPEARTFRGDPAFQRVLGALNSGQYPVAIKEADGLLPLFSDFDLLYKWLSSAYLATNQPQRSRDILVRGLGKANRKAILLTQMGETQWRMGNLHQAVYCWCQAVHCMASIPTDGLYDPYLLLSCVARGCGLGDVEQRLLGRVDAMRAGQIRLDPGTEARLMTLVRSTADSAMTRAVQTIDAQVLRAAGPAAASAAAALPATAP